MVNINSYNASRILQTIWQEQSISRIAIAKKLDLNKSTITKNLVSLIEDGIIISKEKQESGKKGGRKAEVLTINEKFGHIMGLEIQLDKAVLCVTDLSGKIILQDEVSNGNNTGEFLEVLTHFISQSLVLCKRRDLKILGASIGLAGIINTYEGMVIQSNSMGIRFPEQVYGKLDKFPFPILIENDANCCCSKELVMEKSSRFRNFLCVLGEFNPTEKPTDAASGIAIGLGLALKGSVLHGRNFSAGEFQSINKVELNPSQFDLTLEELAAFRTNEKIQRKVIRELSRNLSLLVNTMNFSSIYFEGNIIKQESILRPILRDEIQRSWPFDSQVDCQLIFAEDGTSAVAHGAACLFLEKLFSPPKFWENYNEFYPSGIELFEMIKDIR